MAKFHRGDATAFMWKYLPAPHVVGRGPILTTEQEVSNGSTKKSTSDRGRKGPKRGGRKTKATAEPGGVTKPKAGGRGRGRGRGRGGGRGGKEIQGARHDGDGSSVAYAAEGLALNLAIPTFPTSASSVVANENQAANVPLLFPHHTPAAWPSQRSTAPFQTSVDMEPSQPSSVGLSSWLNVPGGTVHMHETATSSLAGALDEVYPHLPQFGGPGMSGPIAGYGQVNGSGSPADPPFGQHAAGLVPPFPHDSQRLYRRHFPEQTVHQTNGILSGGTEQAQNYPDYPTTFFQQDSTVYTEYPPGFGSGHPDMPANINSLLYSAPNFASHPFDGNWSLE